MKKTFFLAAVAAMTMFGTAHAQTGENLALNKTAYAGQVAEDGLQAANDGNPGTRWGSNGGKHCTDGYSEAESTDWWYVDLGAEYKVGTIRILFEGACAVDYDLLISKDAQEWTKIGTYPDRPKVGPGENDWNVYKFTDLEPARYVKIFTRNGGFEGLKYGFSMWEFEVYEFIEDTEKPVLTDATIKEVSHDVVTVTIEGSDNIGITECLVVDATNDIHKKYPVKDGVLTISDLTPEVSYSFAITALDDAGNQSADSKIVTATTLAHFYEPTTAAPVPTVDAKWVVGVYSETYSTTSNIVNQAWAGSSAMVKKTINGNEFLYFTSPEKNGTGYAFSIAPTINASTSKYIHADIWAEEDMTVNFHVIAGGPEPAVKVTLKKNEWNSVDVELAEYSEIPNWEAVWAIKFIGTNGKATAVDNVYFYTDPIDDSEAPTDVTATATASFTSLFVSCTATDNSGVVVFNIFNGDTQVATGSGKSGEATTIEVKGLTIGTDYTLTVKAADQSGNEAAPFTVTASTQALPASAPAPTAEEENVYAIYSDAYTTVYNPYEWNQNWYENPTFEQMKLGEDNVLFYTSNGNVNGCFGWAWDNHTFDLTGYTKLHYAIYPVADGTVEFGITRKPDSTPNIQKVFTLKGGEWNQIELDLAGQDLTKVFQLGFWNFSSVKQFFLDNVYFEKPASTPTSLNQNTMQVEAHKVLRNGQVLILRDGKTYNILGIEVK